MEALEAMSKELLVVPPDLALHRAWRIMRLHRIRHLLVARGEQLLGLLGWRTRRGLMSCLTCIRSAATG